MNIKRTSAVRVVCLGLVLGGSLWVYQTGGDGFRDFVLMYTGTPHERYAASLRRGQAGGVQARMWIASSEQALADPVRLKTPGARRLAVNEDAAMALAYRVTVERGRRLVVDAALDNSRAGVFVDVFERHGSYARRVASAPRGDAAVAHEPDADADCIVRIQLELFRSGELSVAIRTEPTLLLPVEGANVRSVQSSFGAPRDSGRRSHEGVDIFATRGTPVRAAASGVVTSVGPNGLGGKTIWIHRPLRGESHYYAHLDRQLVSPGAYVNEGDVIGLVGNTGNARTTAPHLHFGIYTARGAVDPLPYIAG